MTDVGFNEASAAIFAATRHAGKLYGTEPYTVHLLAVRTVLHDFGFNGDFGPAAWLHDTIEDTATTREEIEAQFGPYAASLVWAVTGVGATRAERNHSAYEKIVLCPGAVILKLADRIANVEASAVGSSHLAMYAKEHAGFMKMVACHSFNEVPPSMVDRLAAAIRRAR